MKIAYVMRFWPVYGGGETVTRVLANELAKRNHEISIIYLWDRDNDVAVFVDTKIKTIKLNDITNKNDGDIIRSDKKEIKKQLQLIFIKERFDIIVNQWLPSKEVYTAARGTYAKVIKCHHGVVKFIPTISTLKQKLFYGLFGKKAGWLRVYWQRKEDYVYSDKWVFLSDAFVADAKKLLHCADDRAFRVIPNPLHYSVDSATIDVSKKARSVLYVGRMISLKRVHFLLDVWKRIQDNPIATGWNFTLVGDGVTLADEISYAKRIGCSRVIFEGFKDPRPYYQTAAIVTMASMMEGFGMVLVEAQQYGCVPLALDSFPTVRSIIQDGRNGILVEDGNEELFAKDMLALMKNDSLRTELAKCALHDCQKFSVENIVDTWENLFKEMMN